MSLAETEKTEKENQQQVASLNVGSFLLRTPVNNIEYFPPNFGGLVLGCIDADFRK